MNIPNLSELTPNSSRESQLRKNFPEFCEILDIKFQSIEIFNEKMWLYYNNLTEAPKCPVCGNTLKFISLTKGYKQYCSKKCSNSSPEKIELTKQRNIEKFGVSAPAKCAEVMEKIKNTNRKKYGVDFCTQNKAISEKIKNTYIERHGGIGNASAEIREKQRHTMLERYGVENSLELEDVRNKIKATLIERYGADTTFGSEIIKEKARRTIKEKYGTDAPIQNESIKEKIRATILNKYGVPWYCQTKEFQSSLSNDSKANKEFAELLERYNIEYEREFPLENLRYDFKIGNILIEINPMATHNSTWRIKNKEPLEKNYHFRKTRIAEKYGYKCIHVWDWDNKEQIVKSLIQKQYPDNCEIKEMQIYDSPEINIKVSKKDIIVCAICDNNIFGTMIFGKSKSQKHKTELKYVGENISNILAIRMFLYYIQKYSPDSVITHIDRSKNTGKIFEALGFRLSYKGKPNLHWYNKKIHITDTVLKKLGFNKIFSTDYSGQTDSDLMKLHRFVEIWDSGTDTYVWRK